MHKKKVSSILFGEWIVFNRIFANDRIVLKDRDTDELIDSGYMNKLKQYYDCNIFATSKEYVGDGQYIYYLWM